MKAMMAGIALAIVLAIGSAMVLDALQQSSATHFSAPDAVRL
jgi:hypothetical protein